MDTLQALCLRHVGEQVVQEGTASGDFVQQLIPVSELGDDTVLLLNDMLQLLSNALGVV